MCRVRESVMVITPLSLSRITIYWAGFLGIVGLALPSTLMTSCGL